jgi:hypothetical protein
MWPTRWLICLAVFKKKTIFVVMKDKKPWEKPNPKKGAPKKMTPSQKKSAKASAKKAGRPYPNLVDNMNASKKK